MSKYPNDAKRLAILQDYLTSDLSKYAIAKKYQISRASILHWIRKFGFEDKPHAEFTNQMKENTPKDHLTPERQTEMERSGRKTASSSRNTAKSGWKTETSRPGSPTRHSGTEPTKNS